MQSPARIEMANLQAIVMEAVAKLTVEDITATDKIGKSAAEILKINERLVAISQKPLNIVGMPVEAVKQLQEVLDEIGRLKRAQQEAAEGIVWAIVRGRLDQFLVSHLTTKKEE